MCNPQPRIMEHRNLKDNALSGHWAREPEREWGSDASYGGRCSRTKRPETAASRDTFWIILTENGAVWGGKIERVRRNKHRYEAHKNEVITVFRTLEEDMKRIVPAFIYISPAYYQAVNSLMCTTYSNSKSDEGQRLRSKDSTIYRQAVGILRHDDHEQSCSFGVESKGKNRYHDTYHSLLRWT